jgi:DHA3 family macrolide efflux protein-like MFS transporter
MLTGWFLMGLSSLLIATAPSNALWLALVGTFIGGFMNPIANGTTLALIQAVVAPEMQGRVLAAVISLATAMSPFSVAAAGPIADAWGMRLWYMIRGIGPAALMLAACFVPSIMHLEDSREAQADTS